MEEPEYLVLVKKARAELSNIVPKFPVAFEAWQALGKAVDQLDQEWEDVHRFQNELQEEADRIRADNSRHELAKSCDGIERIQHVVEDAVRPFREEARYLAGVVKDNTAYCVETAVLLRQLVALTPPPRPANGTRGSVRSPRTGPNAPRPTRASGKTSPSRGGKGKPSRSSASGASPKTPRKATARPKRTARKTPRTG